VLLQEHEQVLRDEERRPLSVVTATLQYVSDIIGPEINWCQRDPRHVRSAGLKAAGLVGRDVREVQVEELDVRVTNSEGSPMADMPWDSYWGVILDRYGIRWMVNHTPAS
jgi:hypothetical protein